MPNTRGAALDYLGKKFGGLLRARPFVTTVGVARINVLGYDSERVFVVMTNLGANDLRIAPDQQVSATLGITISANGGLVSFNVEDDGTMPCQDWWAYGDAAGLVLYTIEVKRDTMFREGEGAS